MSYQNSFNFLFIIHHSEGEHLSQSFHISIRKNYAYVCSSWWLQRCIFLCIIDYITARYIESNASKNTRQGRCRRFPCLALFAGVWFYFSLLSTVFSFVFVCKQSYFPFMSIKKLVPYFCVLRECYYVIIWLIVRICVFIKDWKLIYCELFILKRKSMENFGSWHKLYSMHLPVKRTWFLCLALVQDKKISHRKK